MPLQIFRFAKADGWSDCDTHGHRGELASVHYGCDSYQVFILQLDRQVSPYLF